MPNINFEHKDLTLTRDLIRKLNSLSGGGSGGAIVLNATLSKNGDLYVVSDAYNSDFPNFVALKAAIDSSNVAFLVLKLMTVSTPKYQVMTLHSYDDSSIVFASGIYTFDFTDGGDDAGKQCVMKVTVPNNGNQSFSIDFIEEIVRYSGTINQPNNSQSTVTVGLNYTDVDHFIYLYKKNIVLDMSFDGDVMEFLYSGQNTNGDYLFSSYRVYSDVLTIVEIHFVASDNDYAIIKRFQLTNQQAAEDIEKTYAEMMALIANDGLVSNQTYRITDFETTSSAANTQCTGEQMIIRVKAENDSRLFPEAKIVSCNETVFGTNYLKWKVLYDINNDTSLYSWADTVNGKGVIYYLEDERGNCCDYDFKNIKFIKNGDTNYYFTFSYLNGTDIEEASVKSESYCICNNNVIKSKRNSSNVLQLPFFVMTIDSEASLSDRVLCDNVFEHCTTVSLANPVVENTLRNCTNVSSGISFRYNTIQSATNAVFGMFFEDNTVLHDFTGAVGNFVKYNKFGEKCNVNIGNRYEYCTFENNITGTFTGNGASVRNIHVMSGFTGTFNGSLYDTVNNPSLWVSRTSTGDTKIYSIADLVK